MKIGIITFHRAENFGSALQAFALCQYLHYLGHEAKIIDYVFEGDQQQYNLFRRYSYWKRPQAFLGDLMYLPYNIHRKSSFASFRKSHLPMTDYCCKDSDTLESLNKEFDCFICGSDQIWNINCLGTLLGPYFLDFADNNKLKIALSPSMPERVPEKYYPQLRKLIQRLDYVSVREECTVSYLKKDVGVNKEIINTVDPTLLLSANAYLEVMQKHCNKQKYIFVYLLGDANKNIDLLHYALQIQQQTKLKIKYIYIRKISLIKNGEYCFGVGPIEFLQYIVNAAYVITDSFHATVFSVLFERHFIAFKRENSTSRISSFLKKLGIEERIYNGIKTNIYANIDYENVIKKLETLKSQTVNFLNDALMRKKAIKVKR